MNPILEMLTEHLKEANKLAEELAVDIGDVDTGPLGLCPKCGGRLRVCTGRNGEFIGCSNYPDCRYTKDVPKNNTPF